MKFKFVTVKKNSLKNNAVIVTTDKLNSEKIQSLLPLKDFNLNNFFKNKEFKGKSGQNVSLSTESSTIKFFSIGKSKSNNVNQLQKLGASIYNSSNLKKNSKISVYFTDDISNNEAVEILTGLKLRSYFFNKFITKKIDERKNHIAEVTVLRSKSGELESAFKTNEIIADGVEFTKSLCNEPANYLTPQEFSERCKSLESIGLKVKVLDKTQMKKLGMGALLGVAQGSPNEPKLVIMEWMGDSKSEKPVAFVGKGVVFDTGGLSLKPANSMVGMKYDMSGAAVVTGLMKVLAERKAKINAIGVLGLVENSIDGNAQRPEDIVTSMSGQTIEVLNTDAEGRLVLADALWYTQDKYDPKFIVDLATLTGAIIVTLADKHAGLFSNNDKLANQLTKAGMKTGEKVWRLPISDEYDKMIDSKKADMQNISAGYGAGSITAAQFLQRFVNSKTWAHIDIAGVDNLKTSPIHQEGSTGFGVQLLNQFIIDNYEAK